MVVILPGYPWLSGHRMQRLIAENWLEAVVRLCTESALVS